jgi:hypothetical protein
MVAFGGLLVISVIAVAASGVVSAFSPAFHPSHGAPSDRGWGPPTGPYSVTFQETGLPANTTWSVSLATSHSDARSPDWKGGGGAGSSTNGTIVFLLANGTFHYAVGPAEAAGVLYAPTPSVGNFTVNGSNLTENVTFAPVPLYTLAFTESGLPNGTFWSVALGGVPRGGDHPEIVSPLCDRSAWNGSTNVSVNFSVPNGTYDFSVANVSAGSQLYSAAPAAGNVSVNGSNVTVFVTFTPEVNYLVTFAETGLPNGTFWSVQLAVPGGNGWPGGPAPDLTVSPQCDQGSGWNGSANSTLGFEVPNGTYAFEIASVPGNDSVPLYVPAPGSGNVTVNGTNVTVAITFAPLVLYNVTFTETGLPNGTFWSVGLVASNSGGGPGGPGPETALSPDCYHGFFWNGSSNSTVGFSVPDGAYGFFVANSSNGSTIYVPTPANGSVTVNGSDVVVSISFAPVALYNVTFVESGLPNGTDWYVVVVNGTVGWQYNDSNTSTVGFALPNGSYQFLIGNASNCTNEFVPSPMNGAFAVNGSAVTLSVEFTTVTFYNLTFNETGLPNGTGWFVALYAPDQGWFFNSSNSTEVSFLVPNGTYGFEVGIGWGDGGYYNATPAVGSVNVTSSNLTFPVVFTFTTDDGSDTSFSPDVTVSVLPARVT